MFTYLFWRAPRCMPDAARVPGWLASPLGGFALLNGGPADTSAGSAVPRLLGAVERLCVEMSPSDVTMRKIAAEAGLSVGLAYRYFASKDELLGAALDRMGQRIVSAAVGDDPLTAIPALWKALGDNPAFPRLVTTFAMSGRYAPDVMSEEPLMHSISSASATLGIDDPETVAGVTGVLVLAGAVFAPTINRAIERDPDDPRVYDAVAEMFAAWIKDRHADGRRT